MSSLSPYIDIVSDTLLKLLPSEKTIFLGNNLPPEFAYLFGSGIFLIYLLFTLSRPKYFFFVRHGETILNAKHIRQGEDGGLSPKGINQAEETGKNLVGFKIKTILSSPFERTKETALILNKYIKVPIKYNKLFAERRNPSEIIGKEYTDPITKEIIDHIDLGFHEDNYRYSDEENFSDLKSRANKCLSFLSKQSKNRICVVTHGIFLKMLVSYMLYREKLNANDYIKISFFYQADNSGITIAKYYPLRRFNNTHGFEILFYNLTTKHDLDEVKKSL